MKFLEARLMRIAVSINAREVMTSISYIYIDANDDRRRCFPATNDGPPVIGRGTLRDRSSSDSTHKGADNSRS